MDDLFSMRMRYMLCVSAYDFPDTFGYFEKLSELLDSAFSLFTLYPEYTYRAYTYDKDSDAYRPFNYDIKQYLKFKQSIKNIKIKEIKS